METPLPTNCYDTRQTKELEELKEMFAHCMKNPFRNERRKTGTENANGKTFCSESILGYNLTHPLGFYALTIAQAAIRALSCPGNERPHCVLLFHLQRVCRGQQQAAGIKDCGEGSQMSGDQTS